MKAKTPNEDAAEQLVAPEFLWPIQIAGFSALLSDEEMELMDGRTSSNLLSGQMHDTFCFYLIISLLMFMFITST